MLKNIKSIYQKYPKLINTNLKTFFCKFNEP